METKNHDSMRKLKASLTKERRDREWPEATCKNCLSTFRYHFSWVPVPAICRSCRTERKIPYKPGENEDLYLDTHVVSGGSSGSSHR